MSNDSYHIWGWHCWNNEENNINTWQHKSKIKIYICGVLISCGLIFSRQVELQCHDTVESELLFFAPLKISLSLMLFSFYSKVLHPNYSRQEISLLPHPTDCKSVLLNLQPLLYKVSGLPTFSSVHVYEWVPQNYTEGFTVS